MAKMRAAKYNPQIRKVFDIAVKTFSNLLRNQRALGSVRWLHRKQNNNSYKVTQAIPYCRRG